MTRSASELELAALIVAWLEADGWEVYQEVAHFDSGRFADIVAWKAGVVWVVEVKASTGLDLLEQGCHYRDSAHRVSLAAPLPLDKRIADFLIHDLAERKMGFFDLGTPGVVSPILFPKTNWRLQEVGFNLRPEHRVMAKAGTQSGGRAGGPAEIAEKVRAYVQQNHGCGLDWIAANAPGLDALLGKGVRAEMRLHDMLKKKQIPGVRIRKHSGKVCLYPDDSPMVSGSR